MSIPMLLGDSPPTPPPLWPLSGPLGVPTTVDSMVYMQTEREKANAVDMHTTFQQDLVRLRLATAKAYMKVLTDGQVWPLQHHHC